MTAPQTTPPTSPCTSSDLLNYVEALQGGQIDDFKLLVGGAARSSYSIYYMGEQTFDMFVNIADDWHEMTRSEFLAWHGDGERIWHIYLTIPEQ